MINFREKVIIIKYAELSTKSDNINFFIKTLKHNIESLLQKETFSISSDVGRMIIYTENIPKVMEKLKTVVVGGISLRAKEKSYLAQETELKKQIDEEKARSQEIDDMEAYVGTDEYVEEIAKEKLGLVNENEIILKAK